MAIQEIRVANHWELPDPRGEDVLHEIRHALKINGVKDIRTAKVYRLEGIDQSQALFLAENLFCERLFQSYTINRAIFDNVNHVIEVAYKPGVMNPEAASIVKAAADLQITGLLAADSSIEYAFYGELTPGEMNSIITRLLVNETVERVVTEGPSTLIIGGSPGRTGIIPIRDMSEEQLMELSRDKLFLNLDEMKVIQNYYRSLGREATDCEIETLAQTWSEHCGHKTFKARLLVDGREKTPLLRRLQQATEQINHPLVLSAFVDNSGVMEFYDGYAICGKVETHNSPSAIEPYGGAMTGSGGVFRDIMGTGLGASVMASTDMFCFAPPDTDEETIPPGCLNPNYLLRRVVAGVRDYGNRMGIPTNNGSVHFHRDFRAKPTVIVGAYGLLPVQGARQGKPAPEDLAVVIGGRTGRDGIHGATFSSGEMTDRTMDINSSAVQIGNAIEEKRMADAILEMSARGLIRAITDCGAGGFSSALGEMGSETGVEVWLERAPLKYPGLAPWEIWVSESQERMVMAIAPHNIEAVMEICRMYNVEATVLGKYTDTGRLVVTYREEVICDLDMEFLHDGLPRRTMTASWRPPVPEETGAGDVSDWPDLYGRVMAHLNVCSKEPIVRVYDHGVQASTALPPYGGVRGDGPNDAAVITPLPGKPYGAVVSHGLNPVLNSINPYYGSLWAAAEAVSNAVAAGANPEEMVLIDNFIWPYPDEESLGALDMAVDACVDFALATKMPFISGKDSLSSTYRGKDDTVIKIPPVLCVSTFGRIPDVSRTLSADFKGLGNLIALVGKRDASQMAGSTYADITDTRTTNLPQIDLTVLPGVFKAIYDAAVSGKLLACHDISEGGLGAALAEMCFGGGVGAGINIPPGENPRHYLFNETAGCFLVELAPDTDTAELFGEIPHAIVGKTSQEPEIKAGQGGQRIFCIPLEALREAWKRPMKEVFGQ